MTRVLIDLDGVEGIAMDATTQTEQIQNKNRKVNNKTLYLKGEQKKSILGKGAFHTLKLIKIVAVNHMFGFLTVNSRNKIHLKSNKFCFISKLHISK